MRKLIIALLGSMLIFSCGKSPDKLLLKGEKYVADTKIDKAVEIYQQLIDKFPMDSLAPIAKYNIAWIELDNKNNYSGGLDMLTQISEKYPDHESGKSAGDDVNNFPKWLLYKTSELRKDTILVEAMKTIEFLTTEFKDHPVIPEALYLKGNIYLNNMKDFYRAINTYQEIVYRYKGTSFEPMAQFMIGYIYANVQSDFIKAEKAYRIFLENYPEHELVPSVQFELEYLGKQINNIDELSSRNQN